MKIIMRANFYDVRTMQGPGVVSHVNKGDVKLIKQETHFERPARRGTSRHGTARP